MFVYFSRLLIYSTHFKAHLKLGQYGQTMLYRYTLVLYCPIFARNLLLWNLALADSAENIILLRCARLCSKKNFVNDTFHGGQYLCLVDKKIVCLSCHLKTKVDPQGDQQLHTQYSLAIHCNILFDVIRICWNLDEILYE